MKTPDDRHEDGAGLRWLFLDLNSYFASVEQQYQPDLRGRPVIVRPAPSEYTCAIAASYEARPFGIRTGTRVMDARKLCPGLAVVEARPDLYVTVHKQIMAEIDRHLPIWKVCSIDEAACELTGPQRLEANAIPLARRVQAGIQAAAGDCLRSSVGLAPSRLLAKTACGMQKPDGLTVLRADQLPGRLLELPLSALPGVGPRMTRRLQAAGIHDMAGLWALGAAEVRRLWNSIEGERIWRGLHGLDSAEPPERPRASISHSHVLAQAMRTPDGARAVVRRLTVKCGARLRRLQLTGGSLTLIVDMPDGAPRKARRRDVASLSCTFAPTCDSFVLLKAVDRLWEGIRADIEHRPPNYVGVAVHDLRPVDSFVPDLLGWSPDQGGQSRSLLLSQALDRLNARFGKDTVSIGPRADLPSYVGAKIAFNRIPEDEEFRE